MRSFCAKLLTAVAALEAAVASPPLPLIIDTDMAGDVDDVGALCVAHALADAGEANILAVVHDALIPLGIEAVRAINQYFNRGDILLGAYQDRRYCCNDLRSQGPRPFVHQIVAESTGPKPTDKPLTGVEVYRRTLAAASDGSVVIALIGFATNIQALLESKPDKHSGLSGSALVARKVKRLIWMGGRYPDSRVHPFPEFNFAGREGTTSGLGNITRSVLSNWPTSTPIIWLGAEIGWEVCHGARFAELEASNPCRRAYEVWGQEGNCCNCGTKKGPIERQSWDPMLSAHPSQTLDPPTAQLSPL